jgi:uncharacterized protein
LIAFGDRKDPWYRKVSDILDAEAGRLVIPAPVTAEVDYLVRRRWGPNAGKRFLQDLVANRFRVESLTLAEYEVAQSVNESYADLDLGLADLSIIVLAHRLQTRQLLTFDERHFRAVRPLQGGSFVLLPRDQ